MDFIIPSQVLKPDQWNHIQIGYIKGNNTFDMRINKSCWDNPTKMPIRNLNRETEFHVMIDTSRVVSK